MSIEGKNVHTGHRFMTRHLDGGDWITVDLDVFKGKRHEVRRRFGNGPIAVVNDEEAARAAFRLLADECGADR